MARIDNLSDFCVDIANAIRSKKGTTENIKISKFDTEIANLPTGTGDISEYFEEGITKGTPGTYKGGWQLAIKKLPPFKFNGTDATGLFYNYPCDEIDLSQIDTSNCKNISQMFYYSSGIINLDVSCLNTQNVENISQTFMTLSKLEQLDMNNLDFSKVNNTTNMIKFCSALTDLNFCENLGKGFTSTLDNAGSHTIDLASSSKLTHNSLISVINKLYDLNLTYKVATGGTLHHQKLILGTVNLAKLTEEEIAIATNKGWTVSG